MKTRLIRNMRMPYNPQFQMTWIFQHSYADTNERIEDDQPMSTVLDPKIIQKVSEQIYKRFPEVMGARPNIKKQPGRKNTTDREKSINGSINFLLTYHGSVEVSEGRKMERWVRVVVNDRGKILKMTTSR